MNKQQEEKSLQLSTECWTKPEVLVLDVKEQTLGFQNTGTDQATFS